MSSVPQAELIDIPGFQVQKELGRGGMARVYLAVQRKFGRLVALNEDPSGRNPHPRMTLTYAGIERARLAVVTVSGEEKAELRGAMNGVVTMGFKGMGEDEVDQPADIHGATGHDDRDEVPDGFLNSSHPAVQRKPEAGEKGD